MGGTFQTHLNPIQKVQKLIVRTISFERRDAHSTPIFVNLKLLKFDYIYKLFSSILVFKGGVPLGYDEFSFFTFPNTLE